MKVFNLSLDDFSPHPKAGLNFESIEWCERLIKKWPEIKINLFVPAAFARLGESPYYLSSNTKWCEKVRLLSKKNYSIGLHGYYHRNDKKHSNNDEFQFLNRQETISKLQNIKEEFMNANISFNKIFRPPAWKSSKSACEILSEGNFVIAGNDEYYNKHKQIPKMRWVSYNWDLNGPCKEKRNVFAYGHTSNWTTNYFCEKTYNFVVDLLSSDDFKFKFLEEVV